MSNAWVTQVYPSITSSGVTVQSQGVRVHFIELQNLATGARNYVRFYNATAATSGTTTADFLLVINADSNKEVQLEGGLSFYTGLIIDVASTVTGASATAGGVLMSLALG